jgi:peptidoglycan hydrolase-like protein with peptidoglycan-binding domain
MRRFLLFALVLCLPLALAGAAVKKKPLKKSGAAKAKPGSKSRLPVRGRRGRTAHGTQVHAAPAERSQQAPTPERYREIQQALASKGYLKSDPSGAWDTDTQDAMRRFQADQKLDQTGKIDALSLISLGLGPKH